MCLPVIPYKVEAEWEHAGLKCAVTLAREARHRCGYVRVPPGHPAHGKGYDDVDVQVHGGLTFAKMEPCAHEDGQGHWLGFDCCHCDDLWLDPTIARDDLPEEARFCYDLEKEHPIPSWDGSSRHYWTMDEVKAECERLADQLKEVGLVTSGQDNQA